MKRMTDVITIPSSDEEDSPRPKKRIKPTPVLSECTLTPIATKAKSKKSKSADIVELTSDSDDDVIETDNEPNQSPKDHIADTVVESITIDDNADNEVDNDHANVSTAEPAPVPEVDNEVTNLEKSRESCGSSEVINNDILQDLILVEDTASKDDESNVNIAETEKEVTNSSNVVDDSNEKSPDKSVIADGEDLILVENVASKEVDAKDDDASPSKDIVNNSLEEHKNSNYESSSSKTDALPDPDSSDGKENTESQNVTVSDSSDKPSEKTETTTQPSMSKQYTESNQILFNDFIDLVVETVKNSKYEDVIDKKLSIVKKYFKRAEPSLAKESTFEMKIKKFGDLAKLSPEKAVIQCSELFRFLKTNVTSNGHVDIDDRHIYKVQKLEKTMKLLVQKIQELELLVVDFDDEEKSPYVQGDRYTKRLKKVYEKYCQYLKRNPFSGRLTYDRIYFCESRFNEINAAINAKYKNCVKSPEYYKIEKVVKTVNKSANLELTDYEIRRESKRCFEKLATVLQRRRKTELYEFHSQFIENMQDPAHGSQLLDVTLKKNYEEGRKKIEDVFEMYVRKQEEKQSKEKVSSEESEDEESISDKEESSKSSTSSDSDD